MSTFEGITLGFSHMLPSTIPSGSDIRISLHVVGQHSDFRLVGCRSSRVSH